MPTDDHHDIETLLPWFVTGRLDAAEHARVETHLANCPQCQAELRIERRLERELAELAPDIEQGWAAMRQRLERDRPARGGVVLPHLRLTWLGELRRGWRPGAVWALVVPALALMLAVLVWTPRTPPDRYHALGAGGASAGANTVLMFRPEAREGDILRLLQASHARLVDGPTAAGAWLARLPPAERAAVLARLRAQPDVTMAEAVDAAGPP